MLSANEGPISSIAIALKSALGIHTHHMCSSDTSLSLIQLVQSNLKECVQQSGICPFSWFLFNAKTFLWTNEDTCTSIQRNENELDIVNGANSLGKILL